MNASAEGSPHSPAWSGVNPSTDCRYCAMNRKAAKVVRKPRMFTASAALNAGTRNSLRSISGSARRRCRRRNAAPTATPARIDSAAIQPGPPSAMRLRP